MHSIRYQLAINPLAVHFLLFSLQLCSSAPSNDNGSFNDEQALLAFKNSLTSDPNSFLSVWDVNTNVCNWTGISCNKLMRVSTVNLESLGLVSQISPVLGNLSSLEVLDISNNSFHDVIPDLGQNLSNLKELHLLGNQLSGPIPTSLGNCSKLKFLDLSLNSLNGNVPLQLRKLSSLQRLLLYDNFLTSSRTLPFLSALINCSSLKTLYLGFNHLAENLFPSIGNLSAELTVLSLQQNLIGGRIPQEIGNLTKLILINFTGNALTGPIPSELEMLKDLERLYLGQNKLQGPIPWEIAPMLIILTQHSVIAHNMPFSAELSELQIAHCDLKPNNVLLDFYMTAHIADFGNAHILLKVLFDAEYGVGGRISPKGDVYSYGILLLEMLTGKRPTHQMFVDRLSLRMWVSMAFPDRISEVVDDSLLLCNGGVTDATCNYIIQLIKVALLCSKDSPKDRPSMAEVVEMLECIEDMFEGRTVDSKYQHDLYEMAISRRRARDLAVKNLRNRAIQTFLDTPAPVQKGSVPM
ncbi:putative receptor-like protein kinase At3g47110 [Cryptomeria japonica]|uniref:putative receptor-like protein kinase At3g47110 n=1 Tax=Cryptomeria japonica TaxID=3369 RepID=UPI0027DA0BDB|nr:putative receptor-like protein kinase At3g47110 [Cryptomeria japonica]